MNVFSIKDLERLSGIKAHTIRIWEQRYSFLKPQRSATNIRSYGNEEIKMLLNVALLNKYGYKISLINKMSVAEIHKNIVSFAATLAYQDRLITDLLHHMIDLDAFYFEDAVDKYIKLNGIEKTINFLIFPFLEKVGILWHSNRINPAQEHLVTNIIRQKIIVGIENAVAPAEFERMVLLFLPEGEHHELGILYMCYLLKCHGIDTLYLGANLPLKDLEFVANLKKPNYLYTHLSSIPAKFNMEKYLQQIHQRLGGISLIISGRMTAHTNRIPPTVNFKKSIAEVIDHITANN